VLALVREYGMQNYPVDSERLCQPFSFFLRAIAATSSTLADLASSSGSGGRANPDSFRFEIFC
jgi:hypothetical protein